MVARWRSRWHRDIRPHKERQDDTDAGELGGRRGGDKKAKTSDGA